MRLWRWLWMNQKLEAYLDWQNTERNFRALSKIPISSATQEPLRSPMVGLVGRYVVGTGEELY